MSKVMKQISIVIPVYNEERFIGGLLNSIYKIKYPEESFEVIVVNDGSRDHTVDIVKQFSRVMLINHTSNLGRFNARKTGVEAAKFSSILFIDSRSVVDPNILNALNNLDAEAVNGYSLGLEKTGLFETFYNAVRRVLFPEFFKIYNQPFYLTLDNFDSMPKGTTVFFADRKVLYDAYDDLVKVDMGKESSDDTRLIRTIANRVPILVHPDVKIINFARTSFFRSIHHLFMRGSKFIDYYFNPKMARFWLVIILPLLGLFAILGAFVLTPLSLWQKFFYFVILDILVTILLAKSFREFYQILVALPLCVTIFYLGVLRGIVIRLVKGLNSIHKKNSIIHFRG